MNEKIIILAPHLQFPLRNGADIYIERLGCHLSFYRKPLFIVGANIIVHYEMGIAIEKKYFLNHLHAKPWAALRTLLFKSHYLREKYLTNEFCQKAKELVGENPEALVVYSFISTASLALTMKPAVIITHNDEITWFQNQSRFSNNPLKKLTAQISEKWIKEFLNKHAKDFVFIHITQSDHEAYKQWMPEHKGFVAPAGVEIPGLLHDSHWDGIIRLLFVGSLSAKMNYDALVFFRDRFWPILKKEFSKKIEVTVLGSHPSNEVYQLCRRERWQLLSDATDQELQLQYDRANFAILPHSYTNGAKLKLLNSLAAGLPVLATTNMCTLPHQQFSPNLYSDNPLEWRDHLTKFTTTGITMEQRLLCQEFASQYTWGKIAADMSKRLCVLEI